jgi:hypothetical protein
MAPRSLIWRRTSSMKASFLRAKMNSLPLPPICSRACCMRQRSSGWLSIGSSEASCAQNSNSRRWLLRPQAARSSKA